MPIGIREGSFLECYDLLRACGHGQKGGVVLGESRTLSRRAATHSRKSSSKPIQMARARGKVGMLWQPRHWWPPAEFPLEATEENVRELVKE